MRQQICIIPHTIMLYILVLVPLVCGWSQVGHMLTAAIAEKRLNAMDPFAAQHFRDLLTSINELVDEQSRTFVQSACWADDLKGSKYGMTLWNPWHFKDSLNVMDTVFPVLNYTSQLVNAINMTMVSRKVLKINPLNNTAERALAARYLLHLVGDIHQPLHATSLFNASYPSGDQGGNALTVYVKGGAKTNLHSYWDEGGEKLQNSTYNFKRPMNLQNITEMSRLADALVAQYGKEVEALALDLDPVTWVQESFHFAKNTSYPYVANSNQLDQNYAQITYEVSKKRIALAGYRMANIVIDLYKNTAQIQPTAMEHVAKILGEKIREINRVGNKYSVRNND